MKKELGALILLFLFGIVFRLWFITLAPQPFGWDQYEYESYAAKILNHGMVAAHSYRSYPFPLLLALVYKIVGFGNHEAIFYLQAILDSVVGLFLYWTIKFGLRQNRAAWIGALLYSINPYTSGYVGVLLAEILTGFFIAGTILTGLLFVKKPSVMAGILFGFFAGMAAETRNAAFIWMLIPVGLTLVWVSWKKYKVAFFALIVGICMAVLYPLYTNWQAYHEINITTVDDFYAKEFFQGALMKRLPPFTYVYPIESNQMWFEYYSEYDPGRTTAGRRAMAQKYYGKAWALIIRDPAGYIQTCIEKMWYVWQKENVFFYQEPGFETHKPYTYAANLVLIVLAVMGLILSSLRVSTRAPVRWVLGSVIGSMLYTSIAFSVTHAEYRLTIPFYSLLILAAALGISRLSTIVRNIKTFVFR